MKEVATFSNSIDAHIAKGLLESQGIACQTSDDAFHQLWPTNEVKLMVEDDQYEQAVQLLKQHQLI
ncbi:MAG: DUF2007 domain-containing protein [Gammaproteobacteria bacterium]|nr:DUF2007 domain-containing protein [Gammaproteobacteria bacterium]MCH9744113.1 DUF2007 domain-containing protein [Gammaproteobacteria bacterium]